VETPQQQREERKRRRKLAIAAAGAALLALEQHALRTTAHVMSAAVDVGLALRLTETQTRRLIEQHISSSLAASRERVREASGEAFEAQTGVDAVEAAAVEEGEALDLAQAVGERWAEAAGPYRTSARAEVEAVTREERYRAAVEETQPALKRTVVTDTYDTWHEEWRRNIDDAVDRDLSVVTEWNAEMDACPKCWALNGTIVHDDESFIHGDPPLHFSCRCRLDTHVQQ
jgi:hypothetical protein